MKYRIISKKENVTNEEIDSFKNFDKILSDYYSKEIPADSRLAKWTKVGLILSGIMITIVIIGYFYPSIKLNKKISEKSINLNSNSNILQPDLPPPIPDSILEADKQGSNVNGVDLKKDKVALEKGPDKKIEKSPAAIEKPAIVEDQRQKPTIVQSHEYEFKEAQPIDGLPLLYEYFENELQYPASALRDSIKGTVIVQFTINKLGEPEEILIKKSLGRLFDIESIRVIKNMPLWSPATVNGRPINSKLSVPLHFNFNNKQ